MNNQADKMTQPAAIGQVLLLTPWDWHDGHTMEASTCPAQRCPLPRPTELLTASAWRLSALEAKVEPLLGLVLFFEDSHRPAGGRRHSTHPVLEGPGLFADTCSCWGCLPCPRASAASLLALPEGLTHHAQSHAANGTRSSPQQVLGPGVACRWRRPTAGRPR